MKRRRIRPYKVLFVAVALTPACSKGAAPRQEALKEEPPSPPGVLLPELQNTGRERALAAMPHFRPLCDADGYPLVGNVARKGPGEEPYQPSEFCTAVRKAEHR